MSSRKPHASNQEVHVTENDNPGLLDAVFESAIDYAIITTDLNGIIVSWNKGAEHIFGYTAAEIIGKSVETLFTANDISDGVPTQDLVKARDEGRSEDTRWHQLKDGRRFWASGVMTPIKDSFGKITGYLKILRDETERKFIETQLIEMTRIDVLTGIANRAAFQERLNEMSATALRNKEVLMLLLLDLDNFKQVNDKWGHPAGDKLLQLVTQRMLDVTRDRDFIARLGGDEFVILQASRRPNGALAEKLVNVIAKPYQIDGNEIVTGVSIGLVIFPQDATDPSELLRKADLALYKVKNDSRNGYRFFSEQLDIDAHNKGNVLAALKRSVKENLFRLEYQPEIDAATGKTVAVEALLRCNDPALAKLDVEEVIALATEIGLMPQIGLWVMGEACAQCKKWHDAGLPHVKMCINFCPGELLSPEIESQIMAILKRFDLSTDDLEIEITEREIFDNQGQGSATVEHLRALGISIAIDDFGTGYSALGQLSQLPIDKLKLDQSFLRHIPANPKSCAIAIAMINLAHTLKLEIIVEGVESAEQAAFFEREHCETLQGFFFSRPMKADDMTTWLSRQLSS